MSLCRDILTLKGTTCPGDLGGKLAKLEKKNAENPPKVL